MLGSNEAKRSLLCRSCAVALQSSRYETPTAEVVMRELWGGTCQVTTGHGSSIPFLWNSPRFYFFVVLLEICIASSDVEFWHALAYYTVVACAMNRI